MGNPRVLNEQGIKALLEANGYKVPEKILVMTDSEHMALTVVMANCLTNGALDRLGLQGVTETLMADYNGAWECDEGKKKRQVLSDYNVGGTLPFEAL